MSREHSHNTGYTEPSSGNRLGHSVVASLAIALTIAAAVAALALFFNLDVFNIGIFDFQSLSETNRYLAGGGALAVGLLSGTTAIYEIATASDTQSSKVNHKLDHVINKQHSLEESLEAQGKKTDELRSAVEAQQRYSRDKRGPLDHALRDDSGRSAART